MKIFAKTIVAASLASVAAIATPAAAQVAGIATSSPEAVIVRSQARINAYQQIDQQFASQITQLRTMRQEMQTLQQSLDTDSNGQISQAEAQANQSVVQQLQRKSAAAGLRRLSSHALCSRAPLRWRRAGDWHRWCSDAGGVR